jgi:phospholipid-binding lipoprotein MlaA
MHGNGKHRRIGWSRGLRAGWLALALVAVGCAKPQDQEIHDRFEAVNRPVFEANDVFDDYAFGPLARGWKFITPSVLRRSISNAQRNLSFPQRFVATLGQAEFEKAGTELGRFLLNSTVGVAGLFDPASRIGMPKYEEDLGKMLARWNVPPGGYIVLPVLGPSTPRDALGILASFALNPLIWAGVSVPPIGVLFAINHRAQIDDRMRTAEASALDYYLFVRDAYIQHRTKVIRNEYVTLPQEGEVADDLYTIDDDLYAIPVDEPAPGAATATAPEPCAADAALAAGEAGDDCG